MQDTKKVKPKLTNNLNPLDFEQVFGFVKATELINHFQKKIREHNPIKYER